MKLSAFELMPEPGAKYPARDAGDASVLDAQRLKLLVDASLALSEVRDLELLLELIAKTGVEMAHCEGCSIYGVEGENLRFLASANAVLDKRAGKRRRMVEALRDFLVPLNNHSIAGFVAKSGAALNLADVYALDPSLPFHFNPDFDQRNDYHTQSLLTLPMCDSRGWVLGVMQFVNHHNRQSARIESFPDADLIYLRALANQVGVLLRNARINDQLRESRVEAVKKFVIASEFTDKDTGSHIERMGRYSALFCELMGLGAAYAEDVRLAAMLHDVGKITTPDAILKKPGPLNEAEWVIMHQHASNGYDILRDAQSPLLQLGATVAQSHHEKWDGSGYPHSLAGDAIPLIGRVVALADVFDALSSRRCYKDPWPMEAVVPFLARLGGSHFDPQLVKLFMSNVDRFVEIREGFD